MLKTRLKMLVSTARVFLCRKMVPNVESSREENVNLNTSMQLNTSYNTLNVGKNNSAPESPTQIPDVSNKAHYPNEKKL